MDVHELVGIEDAFLELDFRPEGILAYTHSVPFFVHLLQVGRLPSHLSFCLRHRRQAKATRVVATFPELGELEESEASKNAALRMSSGPIVVRSSELLAEVDENDEDEEVDLIDGGSPRLSSNGSTLSASRESIALKSEGEF